MGESGKRRATGARLGETDPRRAEALRALQQIPGVGPSISRDFWDLGIRSPEDLRGADPESLYVRHCDLKGARVDRCWLYVARCAVYFASRTRHDPERLKWWTWKDGA